MTYLGFLVIFLGTPIAVLGALTWRAARRAPIGRWAALALWAHVAIAVVYTTPWDNYLVATGVWWYDPARVLGVTLGWVPLEEYLFFMLQPVAAGLLLLALARRLPASGPAHRPSLRWWAAGGAAAAWLASLGLLASGWAPGTYLGLELAWALPPLALQLAVGADILWRHRRIVLASLAAATLYLCAADALAIGAGVWTIDPRQSLPWLIGGLLPIEEFTFFLLTNTLVIFGLTLALAPETRARFARLRALAAARGPARERTT